LLRLHYRLFCKIPQIAIISPCIAKRREFDEAGQGDYNVNTDYNEILSMTEKLSAAQSVCFIGGKNGVKIMRGVILKV